MQKVPLSSSPMVINVYLHAIYFVATEVINRESLIKLQISVFSYVHSIQCRDIVSTPLLTLLTCPKVSFLDHQKQTTPPYNTLGGTTEYNTKSFAQEVLEPK